MFSNKQEEFLLNPLHRINLLYGSVRSGKTWISLLKWGIWVGQQPINQEFLMVGKTITTLKRNCLGLLQTLIGDNIEYSISQKKATIFGRTVWLEGANDERSESKIRGMTLAGCYIDELTQIPRDFYMMALSRLSEKGAVFLATTNPDHPEHYVKTDIIDNEQIDKQVVKFLLDDNIFLDEEYKRNLIAEYQSMSTFYYQRFVLGDFVRAEGLIFPEFAEHPEKHYISADELPKNLRSFSVGYDIGGNLSNYSLVASAVDNQNNVYVLKAKEILPQDLRPADVENAAKDFILGIEKKFGIRANNCYVDDAYYTIINGLNDWRHIFDNAACIKSSMPLHDRPLMLSKLMARGKFKLVKGECQPLVEQLQNAVYDTKCEKAVMLDDGTLNIDCIDSFFYSIADQYLYLTD